MQREFANKSKLAEMHCTNTDTHTVFFCICVWCIIHFVWTLWNIPNFYIVFFYVFIHLVFLVIGHHMAFARVLVFCWCIYVQRRISTIENHRRRVGGWLTLVQHKRRMLCVCSVQRNFTFLFCSCSCSSIHNLRSTTAKNKCMCSFALVATNIMKCRITRIALEFRIFN